MSQELTAQPTINLPLYRLVNGRLVRDDLRGDVVLLKDARWALNAMQSALASTEIGGLAQSHALVKAHRDRGDMLRVWQIIGDPNNSTGMKQDMFQRLTAIMELVEAQKREIERLRTLEGQVIATEKDEEKASRLQMLRSRQAKLGWTKKEVEEDVLVAGVFMRVTQANRPTEIRVTREELEACRALIQRECPPLMMSARKYTLFHNVELIPE